VRPLSDGLQRTPDGGKAAPDQISLPTTSSRLDAGLTNVYLNYQRQSGSPKHHGLVFSSPSTVGF